MRINIMCPKGAFGSLNYLANLMKQIIGNNVTISGNTPKDYKPDHLNILIDEGCLLYTSPSPRDLSTARMPSSA